MSFSNPINIATASVESIYERLCWLYASFRSTFVYNANGQSYPLSDITQLSRAKIPFPERFDEISRMKLSMISKWKMSYAHGRTGHPVVVSKIP